MKNNNINDLHKEDKKVKIICAFDIESALLKKGEEKHHLPNLLISYTVCDVCFNYDTFSKSSDICHICGVYKNIFTISSCVKDFGDYIYMNF